MTNQVWVCPENSPHGSNPTTVFVADQESLAEGGAVWGRSHLENHESACQQVVLVNLPELNVVVLYWETVYYHTLNKQLLLPDHQLALWLCTDIEARPALFVPTRKAGQRTVTEDLPGEGCHGGASDTRLQGDDHWGERAEGGAMHLEGVSGANGTLKGQVMVLGSIKWYWVPPPVFSDYLEWRTSEFTKSL